MARPRKNRVEAVVEDKTPNILDADFKAEEVVKENSDKSENLADQLIPEDAPVEVVEEEEELKEIKPEEGRRFFMSLKDICILRHCLDSNVYFSLNSKDHANLIKSMVKGRQVVPAVVFEGTKVLDLS